MKKILTITFLFAAAFVANAQVCLQPIATYTTGGMFMTNADFNNDGKMDLVTGHSNAIYTMLGDGAGNFTTDTVTHVSYLGNMLSADFNQDGNADLVMCNNAFNGSNILVFLGSGQGGFHSPASFATNLNPWGLTCNDFDNDGNLDLAITNLGVNNMSVLMGDGTGNFGAKMDHTFGNNSSFGSTNQIISQDLNTDGYIDLILSTQDSLAVFLGSNTSGTYSSYLLYAGGPSNNGSYLSAADFTGDGLTDIAASDGTSSAVVVWPGTGTGAFGSAITTTLATNAGNLSSADFDSDGNMDLAICTQNNNYIALLLGTGNGHFQAPIRFADPDVPESCIAYDFNTDGKPDLAVGDQQGGANFMVFLNVAAPNLNLSSSASTNLCAGSSSTLTVSGATTYTWSANSGVSSNTVTTTVVTPTSNATYSVIAQTNGCLDSASVSFNLVLPQTPNICMVSTDSATHYAYNMVIWDKTSYTNVDSFIVYRKDAFSSTYLRIGAVSKDSLSQFLDTVFSIGGPNGGNPLYSSWTYKLAIRDTCGNIGAMSPYHQTMFVQQNNSNFSWNAYTVETGQSNPVTGYSFLRDDNNTGAWHILVNTTGTSSTDPNYASYPNGNWRVDAIGFNCTPTMRLSSHNNVEAHYNKAHSNTNKPAMTTGMGQSGNSALVLIYPNPGNGSFSIESAGLKNAKVEIYSMLGELVYKGNLSKEQNQINLQNLNKGSYTVHIISESGNAVKRIVIE